MIIVTDGRSARLAVDDFLIDLGRSVRAYQPSAVILREKEITDEQYRLLAQRAYDMLMRYNTPLYVNRRAVARQLGSTCLHTGYTDFVTRGREDFVSVSVSVHSAEEADMASRLGADNIVVGHVFDTACKAGKQPLGLDGLRKIISASTVPVWAIGGIDSANCYEVAECGATDWCSMSGAMNMRL